MKKKKQQTNQTIVEVEQNWINAENKWFANQCEYIWNDPIKLTNKEHKSLTWKTKIWENQNLNEKN